MYYQKNQNHSIRNHRNGGRSNSYEDKAYVPSKESRPPQSDGDAQYDLMIEVKSMSKLPKSTYAVKVDPYTEATNPSNAYHFLSRFNSVIGGRYAGVDNLDGGNLIQYNNSVNSGFLRVFDSALAGIGLNYRYLPILASDTQRGNELVNEMRKAIDEVVSSLSATTFMQQNIIYYVVKTDLPMGNAPTKTVKVITEDNPEGTNETVYYKLADVIYAMCLEYQLKIQDIIMCFNMFNKNRTLMGTMTTMSWNREVSILNSYFGLLKKKSFLALFDSIAMNIAGEYVDQDWMRQANMFCIATSRRSDSINDPLLEISASHNQIGTFKAIICSSTAKETGAVVYDSAEMQYTIPGDSSPTTFESAVKELTLKLTVNDTLYWARSTNSGITENDRFNRIKALLDVITYSLTYFKTSFTDLRTILTIMSEINMVKWTLGTRLSVIRDTDTKLSRYLIVDNIYEILCSGSPSAVYNSTTKRWRTHTLWNMYYGVPEYSMKSGGSFLTFSLKHMIAPNEALTDTNIGYLPVAFTIRQLTNGTVSGPVVVLDRLGNLYHLTNNDNTDYTKAGFQISGDDVLARLTPLASQEGLRLLLPQPIETITNLRSQSFMYRFLLQVFGCGILNNGDTALDPDILCIYEYEIEDFTNEVIAYARSKGPFQVSQFTENSLGFFGTATGVK